MPSISHAGIAAASANLFNQVTDDVYGTPLHPFAASSFWNTLLPDNPTLDPNNAAICSAVLGPGTYNRTGTLQLILNLTTGPYAQPCYIADGSTPRVAITGSLAFGRGATATIPYQNGWVANTGADQKINIFDTTSGYVYELDGFVNNNGTLSTYYGTRRSYVNESGDGYPVNAEGAGPTGSGMSQVGGMIRVSDLQSGSIDHALNFLTSNPMSGTYRYPASNVDGTRTEADGLQEGMRIQLDPAVNVNAISGMSAGERMIARALQLYGAFCTDNGGDNNMACGFYVEEYTGTGPDPYAAVGITSDWFQLSHIPRSSLRVLDASMTPQP